MKYGIRRFPNIKCYAPRSRIIEVGLNDESVVCVVELHSFWDNVDVAGYLRYSFGRRMVETIPFNLRDENTLKEKIEGVNNRKIRDLNFWN